MCDIYGSYTHTYIQSNRIYVRYYPNACSLNENISSMPWGGFWLSIFKLFFSIFFPKKKYEKEEFISSWHSFSISTNMTDLTLVVHAKVVPSMIGDHSMELGILLKKSFRISSSSSLSTRYSVFNTSWKIQCPNVQNSITPRAITIWQQE